MQTRRIVLATALVLVGLASFAAGTVAQPRFGEINRAERSLCTALYELQRARNIFGGHKRNAEGPINQALSELQIGKRVAVEQGY